MLTDYDVAKQVQSKLVIHSNRGPGVVTSVNDDVTVSMYLPELSVPSSQVLRTLAHHEKLMFGALIEMADDVEDEVIVSVGNFVKDPSWSLAPSERDILTSEMKIMNSKSNFVVPSSNPPRPVLHKERSLEQHREFLDSRTICFDNAVASHAYQIQNVVDWQLGWFLLRGNEKYPSYMDRISSLQSDLGKKAWSTHLLPVVDEASRVHLVKTAAAFAAVAMAVRDIDAIHSIRWVSHMIETRLATLYSEVINGFTRSYFKDRNRRSQEREHRNELSA